MSACGAKAYLIFNIHFKFRFNLKKVGDPCVSVMGFAWALDEVHARASKPTDFAVRARVP